jgi:hypothetical protein
MPLRQSAKVKYLFYFPAAPRRLSSAKSKYQVYVSHQNRADFTKTPPICQVKNLKTASQPEQALNKPEHTAARRSAKIKYQNRAEIEVVALRRSAKIKYQNRADFTKTPPICQVKNLKTRSGASQPEQA